MSDSQPAKRTRKKSKRSSKTRLRLILGRSPYSLGASFDTLIMDQGILRLGRENFHEIAPNLWRSNQPTPERLARYHAMGVRRVINLRGSTPYAVLSREREACESLGIKMREIRMNPEIAPGRTALLRIVKLLKDETPTLIHCRAGADRTGLISAFALILRGESVETAREQLSWKYGHFRYGKAGIMGHVLEQFAQSGNPDLRDWIKNEYDPKALPPLKRPF